MSVVTNDLKKGAEIRLRNGWTAQIRDNAKGTIRMCLVRGTYEEIGSVYAHDIIEAQINGQWVAVEHTDAQKKLMAQVKTMGF